MNKKLFVFFLGGYDAEMCEIRKILVEQQQKFYDHRLGWGSKLSEYENILRELPNSTVPVLIELGLDTSYPSNSIIVDHHDLDAGKEKPASIEQVAELLNIKLSRWQRLIAINDVGWIDGLIEAGATAKEIEEIRRYDRRCQGVNEQAEKQAEQAIKNMTRMNNLAIVEIPHTHASAVMDRLYGKYENILVYSPNQTNFSGRGDIVKMLSEKFPQSWFGGRLPEKGFWGIQQKNKYVQEIVSSFLEEGY